MERKSELTKALLGEKFKELVAKKGFEKLTIKMITDAAGVIRPTFYNYFQDKYEVMVFHGLHIMMGLCLMGGVLRDTLGAELLRNGAQERLFLIGERWMMKIL